MTDRSTLQRNESDAIIKSINYEMKRPIQSARRLINKTGSDLS